MSKNTLKTVKQRTTGSVKAPAVHIDDTDPYLRWYRSLRSADSTNIAAFPAIEVELEDGVFEVSKRPYHFVKTVLPRHRESFQTSLERHKAQSPAQTTPSELLIRWADDLGGEVDSSAALENCTFDDLRVDVISLLADQKKLAVVYPESCRGYFLDRFHPIVCEIPADWTADTVNALWDTTLLVAKNTADTSSPVLFGDPGDFDNSHSWIQDIPRGSARFQDIKNKPRKAQPLESYEIREERTDAHEEARGTDNRLHIGRDGTLYSPITGAEIVAVQPTVLCQ